MFDPRPLIVTLALDEASFRFFEAARQRHFPPERNLIPAHVTLFHALPGEQLTTVRHDLDQVCRTQAPLRTDVVGLRSLGHGVAYTLESVGLSRLRDNLADRWGAWLTAQDRQKHRPHVTVQNKVDPEVARALLAELQTTFEPFAATGQGLHLWSYRGGPWDALATIPFTGG
jgi:hypothetical protein